MAARLAADAVMLLHAAFVVFAVLGGLLALRWPRAAWAHLPAAAWAFWIEATGGLCPLTLLEDRLRIAAGEAGSPHSFIERCLLPLLYPLGLTRELQGWLAAGVVGTNLLVYGAVLWHMHTQRRRAPPGKG